MKPLPFAALAGLATVGGLVLSVQAQQPATPAQGSGPPVNSARMQSVPMVAPVQAGTVYTPYLGINAYDPFGGYMNGAANVINSQGNFMVSREQANQMKQETKRSKLQTRRAQLDEYNYERKNAPTTEDQAERARIEQLRYSRNDPPLTVIWSGKALNDLMLGIQRQLTQGVRRPDIPLAPDIVSHINVTGGQGDASLTLLKNGGRLQWPYVFIDDLFTSDRQQLDKLAIQAYSQAANGPVDPTIVRDMTRISASLKDKLRGNAAKLDPNSYIGGQRFLTELDATLSALQRPDVSNYLNGAWQARGDTVAQLVANMTGQGVRFGPAGQADQSSYTALHRGMATYYEGPNKNKPWDPLAK
jgi:hypothetical protein